MATIQGYNRRSREDKRKHRAGQVGGRAPFIRLASLKPEIITGEQINGGGEELAMLGFYRDYHGFLQQAGFMPLDKHRGDRADFFRALDDAEKRLGKAYDDVDFRWIVTTGEQGLIMSNDTGITEDSRFFFLEDLQHHPRKIKNILYSCLHLITKMGFTTIDNTPTWDSFMGMSEDDFEDEDNGEAAKDHKRLVNFYEKKKPFAPVDRCYERLVRQCAKQRSHLAEWCRLCLDYAEWFNIRQFQPIELYEEMPVTVTEGHIIAYSPSDRLWEWYASDIDSSYENYGTVPIVDYRIVTKHDIFCEMAKLKKPLKEVGRDINRIWNFNLKTLKFYKDHE